jgi:hypothetical protein
MKTLEPLFRRLGVDPSEIAGTSLAGEIPIAERLINRLIEQRLGRHAHVASVRIAAQPDDQCLVRIDLRSRIMPPLNVLVRIERQPDLPHDPTLRLRWSMPSAGPLATFAGKLAGYFKALPEGVQVDGDVIVVDLRALLRSRGLEELVTVVRRVAVHTRPGAMVVQIDARLPGG